MVTTKQGDSHPLCPPLGTLDIYYDELKDVFDKVAYCGDGRLYFVNKKTGEMKVVPQFCDNRVCLNPECMKHRRYKFLSEHGNQIALLDKVIIKPKGWVFSTKTRRYPIDKEFVKERFRLLIHVLDRSKHKGYGSVTPFSAHLEIKLYRDHWYLHFHVVSGGVLNLKKVRELWGYVIKYMDAIAPKRLGKYVSKYASKVPYLISMEYAFEYLRVVYKLYMHRFIISCPRYRPVSEWILLEMKGGSNRSLTYGEMKRFFGKYFSNNDYG